MTLMLLVCSAFLLGAPQSAFAQCNQTLCVDGNIASAVSSAANGSTICLNSGNYGTVNFTNITRTGLVTLRRSTTGTAARMSPRIANADFIRFTAPTR